MHIATQTKETKMDTHEVTVRSYITNDYYGQGTKNVRRRLRIRQYNATVPTLAHAHALTTTILAETIREDDMPDLANPPADWQSDTTQGWLPMYQWRTQGWRHDSYPMPGQYNLVISQRKADNDWSVEVQLAQVPGSPRKIRPDQLKREYIAARANFLEMQAEASERHEAAAAALGLEPDDESERDSIAHVELMTQINTDLGQDDITAELLATQTALVAWAEQIVTFNSGPEKWQEVAPIYKDLPWKGYLLKYEEQAIEALLRLDAETLPRKRIETWHNSSPAMFRPMTGHPEAMPLGHSGGCMIASTWYRVPAHVTGSTEQIWRCSSATQEEWAGPNPTIPALYSTAELNRQRQAVR